MRVTCKTIISKISTNNHFYSRRKHLMQKMIYYAIHNAHLIKHPLQSNSSCALIFWGTCEPVKIINFIQSVGDCGHVASPDLHWEYLTVGAYVHMTVQQCLKPSTSRPLCRQNCEVPHRIAHTFIPNKQPSNISCTNEVVLIADYLTNAVAV